MSFTHYTFVGHFDPRAVNSGRAPVPLAPLSESAVAALLAQYTASVAAHVTWVDGYVRCEWAGFTPPSHAGVYELAYRLAAEQKCLAVENGHTVGYPKAAEAVRMAWRVWATECADAERCERDGQLARLLAENLAECARLGLLFQARDPWATLVPEVPGSTRADRAPGSRTRRTPGSPGARRSR